ACVEQKRGEQAFARRAELYAVIPIGGQALDQSIAALVIDAELKRLLEMAVDRRLPVISVRQDFIQVGQVAGFVDKIGDGDGQPECIVAAVLFDGGRCFVAGAVGQRLDQRHSTALCRLPGQDQVKPLLGRQRDAVRYRQDV